MKKIISAPFLVLSFVFPFLNSLALDSRREEIPIIALHIAPTDYDETESIPIIIRWQLPNTCYRIGETQYKRDPKKRNVFQFKQFAYQSKKDCEGVPSITRTSKIAVNPLAPGVYTFQYNNAYDRCKSYKKLRIIQKRPKPMPNEERFVAVSGIEMSETFTSDQDVQAIIRGDVSSSCTNLILPIYIQNLRDGFTVYPAVSTLPNILCLFVLKPVEFTINLGVLDPGSYLLSIKSALGSLVNRVFEVTSSELPHVDAAALSCS